MATYFDVVDEAEAAGGAKTTRVTLQDGRTVRIAHNPMSGGGYVATHEDITEAVRAEEHIRYLGSHDGLTGLPNRSLLHDRIGEALARIAPRRDVLPALSRSRQFQGRQRLAWPFDRRPPAEAGRRSACALCLRETDTLARIGGDEFVVLQADIEKPEQAGSLAQPAHRGDGRAVRSRRAPSLSSASASASRSAPATARTPTPC